MTVATAEPVAARLSAAMAARLPEHLGRLGWDAGRIAAHQRDALRGLLAHALAHSPFHARRLMGIDPATFELGDLAALPVMTKAEMMGAYDDVVTDRRITRAAVEAHLDAHAHEAALLHDEFVCLASGGSSGERGVFAQRLEEYAEFNASIVRRPLARLLAAGGPPPGGHVMAIVCAASTVHSTGFATATVTDGPVRAMAAPATLPTPELVARLNAIDAPALMGFPSKLAELAHERRAGRLTISPTLVTATSEMLPDDVRAEIEDAFGVPVVDQFGSTEGLVGHSEPGDPTLAFASDLCIAELVDDAGSPVPDGTPSARVLVTNLHNRTQPLIRYELTDRFTREPGDGHLRARVEGRADEAFRYGDATVHPLVFRTVMVKHPEVREYEVRQTAHGADIAVVADGPVDEGTLAGAVAASLAASGVPGAEVAVRAVDALPRHPQTGKARRFIPLAGP